MTDRIDVELSGLRRDREPDGSPGPWRATFFLQLGDGTSVLSILLPPEISDENIVLDARAKFHALLCEVIEQKADWRR